MKRKLAIGILFLSMKMLHAQSFTEKMMELNISIADTANDWTQLERAAGVFNRLSVGSGKTWESCFYMTLCYVRTADLVVKKDTLLAKSRISLAKQTLKAADTLSPSEIENKILRTYLNMVERRTQKTDAKKLKTFETEILELKKNNLANPRATVLNAYFYLIFYEKDKSKRAKAKELLNNANGLYAKEKPNGYLPRWGKKWCGELLGKVK